MQQQSWVLLEGSVESPNPMRGWSRIQPGLQTGAAGTGAAGRAADGSRGSPAFQIRAGLVPGMELNRTSA